MTMKGQDLPDTLPLFPLRGTVIFPRARLPLNIFEPRYIAMTDYALGKGRLIGMINPRHDDDTNPPLYAVGCAGRITSFSETGDGRYLIELVGVSRFRLLTEHLADGNFRLSDVDWGPYAADLEPRSEDADTQRETLSDRLARYLDAMGLAADWDAIDSASTEAIINSVAMSCPFDADEKQALLEAPTLPERAQTLMTLMEIATAEAQDADSQDNFGRMQ